MPGFGKFVLALRYSGRKHARDFGEIMARIVAERLVEHLGRSGFVIMETAAGHGWGGDRTWP